MLQTTWELIACSSEDPACVLCGHLQATKRMPIRLIKDALGNAPTVDSICAATLHICNGLVVEAGDLDAAVPACPSCHHWMARHRRRRTVPLLALRQFIHKLYTPDTTALDSRVIVRLARTLSRMQDNTHNYYMTLFTPDEQELFRLIATATPRGARRHIARFYMASNIETLYVSTAHAAEFLRENLTCK